MLWDSLQHLQIASVKGAADRAERRADRATFKVADLALDIKELRKHVESLTLVSMALAELLKQETDLTDDLIRDKIQEIDLLDGTLDGKASRPIPTCSSCKRPNSVRRTHCIYCGDKLSLISPLG